MHVNLNCAEKKTFVHDKTLNKTLLKSTTLTNCSFQRNFLCENLEERDVFSD